MVFVMADSCRARLEKLTQLLFSSFPGSTIYQHTEMLHVSRDVLSNKVDAVVLEAAETQADGLSLVRLLRRQKPEIPVFVISETGTFREKADQMGANGYFVFPDCEQQLLDAKRLVKNKENVS